MNRQIHHNWIFFPSQPPSQPYLYDYHTSILYEKSIYNKQFIKIPNNHNNRIKITLKNTDLSRDFNAIAVYSGIQGYTRGQGIKVWNVKLEEGTKTTPYEK